VPPRKRKSIWLLVVASEMTILQGEQLVS